MAKKKTSNELATEAAEKATTKGKAGAARAGAPKQEDGTRQVCTDIGRLANGPIGHGTAHETPRWAFCRWLGFGSNSATGAPTGQSSGPGASLGPPAWSAAWAPKRSEGHRGADAA
jgi:hypothetical protein